MEPIAQRFHDLYWSSQTWRWTFWRGVPTLKCPLDLWIYQELLWLSRPRLIVELGTWAGGSATYMADMLDAIGVDGARVVTVDILDDYAFAPHVAGYAEKASFPVRIRPPHPRITYVHGDSASDAIVARVHELAADAAPVLVIADSDHTSEHTARELARYHDLVTPGSWFVMEDTDGPGPRAAVEEFLAVNPHFAVDEQCEKFHMTFNPGGYLRRRPAA
jgi:cephalosporin hydroxylase